MSIAIYPKMLRGTINDPSSKTYTLLSILLSSMCSMPSKIVNPCYSDEILTLITALEQIGIKFKSIDNSLIITPAKEINRNTTIIECNNYESILMSLILYISSITKHISFHGDSSIFELLDKTTLDNLPITFLKTNETLNVTHVDLINEINLIDLSSPFLIIGSILYGLYNKQDLTLHINKKLINSSHLKMLQKVLQLYQINLMISEESNIIYLQYQEPTSPHKVIVEGDWLQGSHYLAMGMSNERLIINNLNIDSYQPESKFIDFLKSKGATISIGNNVIICENSFLTSTNYDLIDCPIISLLMLTISTISEGTSILYNYINLSDRYKKLNLELANILTSMGAKITFTDKDIIVEGVKSLEGGLIDSHSDALILLSLITIANYYIKPLELSNINDLMKKFPYFLNNLKSIEAQIFERNL